MPFCTLALFALVAGLALWPGKSAFQSVGERPGLRARAKARWHSLAGRFQTPAARRDWWQQNGAVITVDPARGVLPRADVHVRDGRIEAIGPDLTAAGAETIDATDMIVMPGFVETHHHMWSSLGRNFVGDAGFGYFPAKAATSKLYTP